MQKITPFLWFDTEAEDAARFYVTLFDDAEVTDVRRMPDGSVLGVSFRIEGQEVQALNGGSSHALTEAFSFFVRCEDQAEVDRLWDALTADGGEESRCGWLVDRFGLSWQIISNRLPELLGDPDPDRARRAMEAMLTMGKIDIATLEAAVS